MFPSPGNPTPLRLPAGWYVLGLENGPLPTYYRVGFETPQEAAFRRGDTNGDGVIDLSDGVAVLLHLFLGAAPPACPDAADSNDDGRVDVSDVIHTLRYLFLSSGSVPVPGPAVSGPDPTADDLTPCEYPPGSCE